MTQSGFSHFWNLRESPFFGRFEINESDLLPAQHALATRILIAAQQGAPIVGIGAEEGAGATTVARWFYENLPEATHFAMILSPGAQGVDPAHLTARIKSFAATRIPGFSPPPEASTPQPGDSLRIQLAALAPVFDALHSSGKKLALVVDNASLLSGEPWAAYLLAVLRQGELIQHVLQFFMVGHSNELSHMMQSWPRVLSSRVARFTLPRPAPADVETWLRTRLIKAGFAAENATKVFSTSARKRLVEISACSLPKLCMLAEGAMIEAFLDSSHVVDGGHVDCANNGMSVGGPRLSGAGHRGAAGKDSFPGSGDSNPQDLSQGRQAGESGNMDDPGLLDLIKPL